MKIKAPVLTIYEIKHILERTYPQARIEICDDYIEFGCENNWFDKNALACLSNLNRKLHKWLKVNGWGYECYDYGIYHLIPLTVYDRMNHELLKTELDV